MKAGQAGSLILGNIIALMEANPHEKGLKHVCFLRLFLECHCHGEIKLSSGFSLRMSAHDHLSTTTKLLKILSVSFRRVQPNERVPEEKQVILYL